MEVEHKPQTKELKSYFTADKQRYTFYFDLSTETPPEKVEIYLEARTLTEEALLAAIDQVNVRLSGRGVQLIREVPLYKVRLVGKNFKPKTDMPCLSLFQKICDLKITEMAVQIPNREKAIQQIQQSKQNVIQKPSTSKTEQPKEVEQLSKATQQLQLGDKTEEPPAIKP